MVSLSEIVPSMKFVYSTKNATSSVKSGQREGIEWRETLGLGPIWLHYNSTAESVHQLLLHLSLVLRTFQVDISAGYNMMLYSYLRSLK